MTGRATLAALISSIALFACATPRASAESTAAGGADSTTVVTMDRGACHGTCPVYAVHLAANGRVTFIGARFVAPIGVDSTRVPSGRVESLRAAFASRKFSAVPPKIEYGTAACGTYVADLSTVTLSVRSADGEHQVRFDEGCRNHPRMLDTLASMIDSVTGSARWTRAGKP